jgi:hypothetical protein
VGHEVLDPDAGHDHAEGEREVPVDEQVVALVDVCAAVVSAPVQAAVVIVGLVQSLLALVRGDVEVVPPQRGGDDEPDDSDRDRRCAPLPVVDSRRRTPDGLAEDKDDQQPGPLRQVARCAAAAGPRTRCDDRGGGIDGNGDFPQPITTPPPRRRLPRWSGSRRGPRRDRAGRPGGLRVRLRRRLVPPVDRADGPASGCCRRRCRCVL